MKSSSLQDAYFRFARLLDTLEKAPGFPQLDDLERKLLHAIALTIREKKAPLVGDIIFNNEIGSPATLSRRLSNLHNKKLIQYAEDSDGRKKYLKLTPKSDKYFAMLGELLLAASSPKAK
jgi:DNA-binding MarR family transcriptional regulator